jgi:nucleotide-binding universal stress UspA family protein
MTEPTDTTRPRIVVAVDGSEESKAALRWAAEEASLRDAELEAVLAWEQPYQFTFAPAGTAYVPPDNLVDPAKIAQRAERHLQETVSDVFGDEPPPNLKQVVMEGAPVAVIMTRALGATLLVIGARGRGGFKGLKLGSVAEQTLRHAPCSVTVVRTSEGD